jgi:protein-S-isoprenylcysteine O-methyltransferase Ste14
MLSQEPAVTMSRSDLYAGIQTLLLVLFAVVFFFVPGPLLFVSRAALRAGTIVCLAALALLLTSIVTLRRVIQVAPAPKAGGHLVSAGIYKVLRHPIYTAMTFLLLGLWLRRPTLATGAAAAIVIVFLVVKSRYEESLLAAAYPDYAAYRARTRGVLLSRR